MTAYADHFRRALEECDIITIRKLWKAVYPTMPQPETDFEVLATIHYARTGTKSITMRQRSWSHRWLLDHNLNSAMPDDLKSKAERIYPKVVTGVGISVNFMNKKYLGHLIPDIRNAMANAVEDAYANHQTEPSFVKARMFEARDKVLKG